MRLWSIHPQYLDTKGLVAVWREGLLARKVLKGKTKGYKNHPQLIRFKSTGSSIRYIEKYLFEIYKEAKRRGYNFDRIKIGRIENLPKLRVTNGQILYEFNHLMKKLKKRDNQKFQLLSKVKTILPHPLFNTVAGDVEGWEVL